MTMYLMEEKRSVKKISRQKFWLGQFFKSHFPEIKFRNKKKNGVKFWSEIKIMERNFSQMQKSREEHLSLV